MQAPQQIQQGIIDDFASLGDAFDQFTYLLELAAQLPELNEQEKTTDVLVKGCQSQVWLHTHWTDGCLELRADSYTLMVRGVIRIFELMFGGQTPQAVLDCPADFVEKTELASIFDSKRKAGVSSIEASIRQSAEAALQSR